VPAEGGTHAEAKLENYSYERREMSEINLLGLDDELLPGNEWDVLKHKSSDMQKVFEIARVAKP
jgi:hypothetical protein